MEWYLALALLLGTVCTAMFLGLPVAFAFFAANILGTALFINGDIGLVLMPLEFHNAIKFTLAPIALFLLMGEILLQTGVAFKAIGAIDRLIARVPGRLAVVSIVGGTVFSSLSGSTIANTAMLGSTLLPGMLKKGYAPTLAMGPIMAARTRSRKRRSPRSTSSCGSPRATPTRSRARAAHGSARGR